MCKDTAAFERWQEIVFESTNLVAQQGVSGTPSSKYGYHYGTPLQIASFFNLTSLAKVLIEQGHKVTERKLFTLMPMPSLRDLESLQIAHLTTNPLDLAVEKQHINTEMVKICIENGCDVNDEVTFYPPFTMAILHEPSYEFVKYLINHGARIDVEDDDSYNALHRFAESGTDPRVLQLLLDAGASIKDYSWEESPLHILVAREVPPLPLVRAYLEAGADVNKDDLKSQRWSQAFKLQFAVLTVATGPLINLVRRGNYEAVKLLIEAGADVNDDDVRILHEWCCISTNALFRRTVERQCIG